MKSSSHFIMPRSVSSLWEGFGRKLLVFTTIIKYSSTCLVKPLLPSWNDWYLDVFRGKFLPSDAAPVLQLNTAHWNAHLCLYLVCSPHTQAKTCQYQFWRESLYTQNNECRTIVNLSSINSLFSSKKTNICGVNDRMFYNKTVSKSGAVTHNSSVPSFLLTHTSTQCQRGRQMCNTIQYKSLCWTCITKLKTLTLLDISVNFHCCQMMHKS